MEEQSSAFNSLREELNKATIEVEQLKKEKDGLEESIKAESAKELEKQLEDQKKLTEEMKRKQEQGSMQTQGEVQELAIEEWLTEKFPLDVIQEIKKVSVGQIVFK